MTHTYNPNKPYPPKSRLHSPFTSFHNTEYNVQPLAGPPSPSVAWFMDPFHVAQRRCISVLAAFRNPQRFAADYACYTASVQRSLKQGAGAKRWAEIVAE